MSHKTYKKLLVFLAIAAAIFTGAYLVLGGFGTSGPSSAPNLEEHGLVGYWNMEEGTGQTVYDRSGNGNNGTLGANSSVGKDDPVFTSGAPSPSTGSGSSGSALRFDGVDDYVSNTAMSFSSGNWSIEAWFRHNNPATANFDGVFNGFNGGANTFILRFRGGTSRMHVRAVGSSATLDTQWDSNTVFQGNTWYHVVGIYDGSVAKFYVNGKIDMNYTITLGTVSFTGFEIGRNEQNNIWAWDGLIDEVRIYNRALSADEIRQHYNQKKPVLEMKFDEGSGTSIKDESFNNNDGTLNLGSGGNTTTSQAWVSGKYGSAISFDGVDDYVNAGNGASLNITGSRTVEAWFKASQARSLYRGIVVKEVTGNYFQILLQITTGKLYYDDEAATQIVSSNAYDDNQWHHVVAVRDDVAKTIKLYADSVLVADTTYTGSPPSNTNALWIGRSGTAGGSYPFNGTIDEPRIYNYARTQDEILTDYNAGKAAHLGKDNQRDDGLVGYWNMEEGTGQTVYDRSGNGNNGTLGTNSSVAKDDPVFASGYSSAGAGGTGLQFDGVDDYVVTPSIGTLSEGTVAYWQKANRWTNTYGDNITQNIVSLFNSGCYWETTAKGLFIYNEYDRIYAYLRDGTSNINVVGTYSNSYWLNNFRFVTVSWNNNTVKLYEDGVLKVTGTGSLNLSFATSLYLGKQASCATNAFNGSIDEVRIYNRALSADEIRQHYNQKKPILEMKFDEGSGTSTKDESFNNNDGTLNLGSGGNTTVANAWVQGKYGSAINFDGTDDYVDAGNGTSLNITSAITVEAWIKSNDITVTNHRILGGSTVFGSSYALYTRTAQNIGWIINDGTNQVSMPSGSLTQTGVWYHIAATWNGVASPSAIMYVYVNGIQYTGTQAPAANARNHNGVTIGKADSVIPIFNGLIDDVKIFNYARTPEQILVDYNAGLSAHFR